jgi:hypothetical protein
MKKTFQERGKEKMETCHKSIQTTLTEPEFYLFLKNHTLKK